MFRDREGFERVTPDELLAGYIGGVAAGMIDGEIVAVISETSPANKPTHISTPEAVGLIALPVLVVAASAWATSHIRRRNFRQRQADEAQPALLPAPEVSSEL